MADGQQLTTPRTGWLKAGGVCEKRNGSGKFFLFSKKKGWKNQTIFPTENPNRLPANEETKHNKNNKQLKTKQL